MVFSSTLFLFYFLPFFLVLEQLFLLRLCEKAGVFSLVFTFLIAVVDWVLCSTEALTAAIHHLKIMAGLGAVTGQQLLAFSSEFGDTLGLATAIGFVAARLLGLRVSYIIGSLFNPFIYFRF